MPHPSVRRLHQAIRKFQHARKERRQEARELRKDKRELKADRRHLKHDRDVFQDRRKEIKHDRKSLGRLRETFQGRLRPVLSEKATLQTQYDATIDPETGLGDPAIKAQLDAVIAREAGIRDRFEPRIDAKKQEVDKLSNAIDRKRTEIKQDRREIHRDRRDIKKGKKDLARDAERAQNARKRARGKLRPAVYHLGLKQTNRVRKALGLKPVKHVIRPMNLNTVKGCAQFLLKSDNVSFWSGLSSGSDRKNLVRLAHGKKARVPATGGKVRPKLSLMKALVDMAKHGRIQINALTGGVHSVGSNHYSGTAVDLDVNVGSPSEIAAIARKYGGFRNFETSHIHLDF